ncbi:MAG: UDP-glucose 4-epimerase GalE [Ignavibacteria bacterium]|jgi:UDP-glucose 4-epimerase
MKILVTGGAGYIGSHCVKELLKKYASGDVIVIDNLEEGFRDAVLTDKFYQCDLRDKQALKKIFHQEKVDSVIHFAAYANVPDSVVSPHKYYENNVIGTINLLECMLEYSVGKIIFSSSASVYGEPIMEMIDENHPTLPKNPYGHTKLIIEELLKWYYEAYHLNSLSFRYFCAAGADPEGELGERHKVESHAIPSAILTALGKRDTFYIYGNNYNTIDGSGVRDYIHVNDLVDAHIAGLYFLENPICERLNLGIGKGFTVHQVVKAVKEVSGIEFNVQVTSRRKGDPGILVADPTRAMNLLNWKPKYTKLEDMVRTAFNFFIKINS